MKKRAFVLLLTLCMLIAVIPDAYADGGFVKEGTCGENLMWTLDESGVLTVSGTGEIPAEEWQADNLITKVIIEDGVTAIGDSAFYWCRSLTEVTIAGSVITIAEEAFYDCRMLSKVTIEDGVKEIGDNAFGRCSLENIYIPATVENIDGTPFARNSDCKINVDSNNPYYSSYNGVLFNKERTVLLECGYSSNGVYTVPKGVKSIGDYAFERCDIREIRLPDSLVSIGRLAFWGTKLSKPVIIPKNVERIEAGAFGNLEGTLKEFRVDKHNACFCAVDGVLYNKDKTKIIAYPNAKNGQEYNIANEVSDIGEYAFCGAEYLTKINIPNSVIEIGDSAFEYCTQLLEMNIPEGITEINDGLFCECINLKKVTIPDGVTVIGAGAFDGCMALKEITIPNSVTKINYAFWECDNLTAIYYYGSEEQWEQMDKYNTDLEEVQIYYKATKINDVTAVDNEDGTYTINASFENINYDEYLVTAVYDNCTVTGVEVSDVTPGDISKIITLTSDSADSAKVFIWKTLNMPKLMCDSKEVQISTLD